jgi:hypothetical protein
MNYTIHQKLFGKKTVAFACQFCAEPLVAPLEDAGTQQPCPRCGNPFTTPGQKELLEQQQAAADREQHAKQAAADERKRALAALEEQLHADRARNVAFAVAAEAEAIKSAAPAVPTPIAHVALPRYTALRIAANIIMGLGIAIAALYIIIGLFILLGAAIGGADNSVPIALRTSFVASGAIFGIVVIVAGLVIGIFTIAFSQLLHAVRDMAINSFHIRHALSLPTP